MKKLSTEDFIRKSIAIHGDKYDYSKSCYNGTRNKVCIICPEHGEFWQVAHDHLNGIGCPKCGGTKKLTIEEFVERARQVHSDKYDYSKVNYINSQTKVCIICPEHGEFWQLPMAHLQGQGCPKCKGFCSSTEEYIKKAIKIHGHKYDYSKVVYKRNTDLIKIICPIHGEFEQRAAKHLIGHGCPKCSIDRRTREQFMSQDEFIRKSKLIHGDKYDYSKVIYKSMHDKVCIICAKHGEFWQYPYDHLSEHGCPKCGVIVSKGEDEIYNYLLQYTNSDEIIRHDRSLLNGKEIDIFLPSKKIGIEYNGLKWHSEEFGKDYSYHLSKTKECLDTGVKLIQIFEDEYIKHKDIVLEKINHICGINTEKEKIVGRKTTIKEINKSVCKSFLNKYHIQGYGKCSKSYGCFYKDKLIGVMSFLMCHKKNEWELVRFASDYHYICCGIGGKLFKHFIRENNPFLVKTFADRRWTVESTDNFYTKVGFVLDAILKPNYRYVDTKTPNERIHKFNLRKHSIHKKYGLPLSMTEREMVNKIGLSKIWDCGLYRYIWTKKEVL